MGGKSKKQDSKKTDVEALLARAAQARERTGALRAASADLGAAMVAKPKPAKAAPAVATSQAKATEIQVLDEMPSTKLPDRVVMIVGGRHYVAPIGKKHALEVAKDLYEYIRRVE